MTIDQHFANSLPQTHSTLSELKDGEEGGSGSKVQCPSCETLGRRRKEKNPKRRTRKGQCATVSRLKLCSLLFLHCGITAPGLGP